MPIPLMAFWKVTPLGSSCWRRKRNRPQLARKLQQAASLRVARIDQIDFIYNGKAIDPGLTVAQAGFRN